MLLTRVLALMTTVVLAGAFPVSVVAARGFRDAPFGAVLRPLPVVILAYAAMKAPAAVGLGLPPTYSLAVSTVAVVGALVSAANALVLLTGRRKL